MLPIRRDVIVAGLACLLLGVVVAPVGVRAQGTQSVAIVGVTVIDTGAGRALPNTTVTIRQGVIVSVVRGGSVAAGVRRLDGAGKFLIPGMWDMHALSSNDR